jgi:hypothetical protein
MAVRTSRTHKKGLREAENEFRAALKLDTQNREAAKGLATSLYLQKRYQETGGPPIRNWDFALYKGGPITERLRYHQCRNSAWSQEEIR